jgi:hypothetical protein
VAHSQLSAQTLITTIARSTVGSWHPLILFLFFPRRSLFSVSVQLAGQEEITLTVYLFPALLL